MENYFRCSNRIDGLSPAVTLVSHSSCQHPIGPDNVSPLRRAQSRLEAVVARQAAGKEVPNANH